MIRPIFTYRTNLILIDIHRKEVEGVKGFKPLTLPFVAVCSCSLSYTPISRWLFSCFYKNCSSLATPLLHTKLAVGSFNGYPVLVCCVKVSQPLSITLVTRWLSPCPALMLQRYGFIFASPFLFY